MILHKRIFFYNSLIFEGDWIAVMQAVPCFFVMNDGSC